MRDHDEPTLEADARLATETPRRLLDAYLSMQVYHRDVGFRGRERREWGLADDAAQADLEQLVAAVDATPALSDADDLADLVSSMNRRAPDLDAATVLGTLLDLLRSRLDSSHRVRTRFAGASATGVDWDHAQRVLAAWHVSLAYSDGDGDETHLPSHAEALVELWSEAAARKKSASPRTIAATGPARAYDPRARYRPGDAVSHARFGEGVVVSVDDARAVIRFASGDRKLAHGPQSQDHGAAIVARPPSPPAAPTSKAESPAVVRRLPPDPRLLAPDAPEQFADLASEEKDDEP